MIVFGTSPLLYYIVVNGVVAILVFFALALFNGFLRQYLQYPNTSEKNNFCTSPNCVRCRPAFLEKDTLLEKLEKFVSVTKSNPQALERLYESLVSDTSSDCVRQRPTTLGLLGLVSIPWHDIYKSDLQDVVARRNLVVIKEEVARISSDLTRGWVRNTSPSGSWYVFHLYNQGEKLEWNCEQCPRTVELIESVAPFMKGCAFGNAMVSMVLPETHITPHYGPTNCRIRCHIPLQIPDGCLICVDQEEKTWTEGEALLFDDSYLHEVWHQGQTGNRIILMLDLWHPEVTNIERRAISYLFSKLNGNASTDNM